MEMKSPSLQRDLMIQQLIEGIEAARELQKKIIIGPSKIDHHDNPQLEEDDQAVKHSLLDKMLASFDKTISIAKRIKLELQNQSDDHDHQEPSNHSQPEGSTPQPLGLNSPRSENSNHFRHLPGKRKLMAKWSMKIKANGGTGLEVLPDDGYSWRKYGQKEILGAKHPRGYYRCTHRPTQGCEARKHVQRTDEDSTIFHVTYCGEHTCSPGPHLTQAQTKPNKKAQVKTEPEPQPPSTPQAQHQMTQSPEPEVYLELGPDGTLKVEPTETESPPHIFRCLSFTPALLESVPMDRFLLDCSPAFGSPALYESNYFPVTGLCDRLNVQTSESDQNGSTSGPNSVSNSPMGCDFEFPIDQLLDIDADFSNFEF